MRNTNKNRKEYVAPRIEVIEIEAENVIAASGIPGYNDTVAPQAEPPKYRTNFYDRPTED